MSRRRKRPVGAHAFDDLEPLQAVLAAWQEPSDDAERYPFTREQVREASPQLGRALDRLANTMGNRPIPLGQPIHPVPDRRPGETMIQREYARNLVDREWFRWFAWRPVWTRDHGWVWLRLLWVRYCAPLRGENGDRWVWERQVRPPMPRRPTWTLSPQDTPTARGRFGWWNH